jgi:phage FluMu gp28-like protein
MKIELPKPWDYQKEIIDWLDQDDVKFASFLKSRQSGGSFLNKLLVSKWVLENNNIKVGYITPTYKLGKRFYNELVKSLKPFVVGTNSTDLIINFNTGSFVQFFSAEAGDSIRGFQHQYTILDEAAYMDDETFNMIIRPTWLIVGKKIIMCSTPNGNQGFFYEHIQHGLNGDNLYRSKCISIYDNPLISMEEIEDIRSSVPEKVWRQEYLGEFLDGSGSVFSNFKNCVGEYNKHYTRYYAAIDWGKTNDYTVLTIINNMKQVVEIYRINSMEYIEQVKLIAAKLNFYKPIQVLSEENNIGTVVNELLKRAYNGYIRRVTLDNSLKKTIIENLVVGFEQKDILIPNYDILLRELQSFTMKYNSSTQTVKYSAPSGLHDDTVVSLAYAYWMVRNGKGRYSIR